MDDPAITLAGSEADKQATVEALLCWWMVLGLPLAWDKGSWHTGQSCHEWIGVDFFGTTVKNQRMGVMQLPQKFLKSVLSLITPLLDGRGSTPLSTILELVGKCSRIAQIIPTARPFAQGMWAAYTAAAKADTEGIRETRFKHHAANRRFTLAARWIKHLIQPDASLLFPLRSFIPSKADPVPTTQGTTVQFDASPWGGGAVLRKNMVIVEYFSCVRDAKSVAHLNVATGKATFQTFLGKPSLLAAVPPT